MHHFIILFIIFSISIYSEEKDSFEYRRITRKNISHILIESYGENIYLTVLASHKSIHAFKTEPHHLKYMCESSSQCLKELKQLNKHLIEGKEVGIYLSGTYITEFVYYPL